MPNTTTRPASGKQTAFIRSLMDSRKNGALYVQTQLDSLHRDNVEALTSTEASNIIGVLLNEPKVSTKTAKAEAPAVTAGIYCIGGEVVKVQKAVHGSGNLYAKRLVLDLSGEGTFEYAPGLVNKITPADKMSKEQAKAFGDIYGVCCACGRTLTDEESIARGLGPICAGKF